MGKFNIADLQRELLSFSKNGLFVGRHHSRSIMLTFLFF